MSTHATIKVEGFTLAKVYKHSDGYPESTLEWLENFNSSFTEKRSDDPTYKFAQLLRSSRFDLDEGLDPNNESLSILGWGVIPIDENYGEEFRYILKKDGTVTYQKVGS